MSESQPSKIPTPPKTTASQTPPKPKPKGTLSQEGKLTLPPRRLSLENAGSPPKPEKHTYVSRSSEAKACFIKAKLHLKDSKNIRGDIKTGVMVALERLYELVKEADAGSARPKPRSEQKKEVVLEKTQERECRDDDLKKKIEEHSKLLMENTERMETLKEAMEKQMEVLEKQSYASVVAASTGRQPPQQTALHSVVVTAVDETTTGEEVLDRIRKGE